MDAATSQRVRQRAANRWEYCQLPEELSGLRFHVEHIVARQHGGTDDPTNLAVACPECNFHKARILPGLTRPPAKSRRFFIRVEIAGKNTFRAPEQTSSATPPWDARPLRYSE